MIWGQIILVRKPAQLLVHPGTESGAVSSCWRRARVPSGLLGGEGSSLLHTPATRSCEAATRPGHIHLFSD